LKKHPPKANTYVHRLIAHLVIVILVLVLTALVLLVVLLIIFHVVCSNLGVINDLSTCASAALDDVVLVDGVTVVLALVFVICWGLGRGAIEWRM
jgi:cell division septal protein FtsQ